MISMDPIGTVHSSVTEAVDDNWGAVRAEIHVTAEFTAGLRGLDQFSHVLIVFLMHQSSFTPDADLVRRPRGRADMPEIGIFAQRAKHRPNPIGITAVQLISVEANMIVVQGLDAIDGTPVLDIKPYVPAFDRVDDANVPAWMEQIMDGYF